MHSDTIKLTDYRLDIVISNLQSVNSDKVFAVPGRFLEQERLC